MTSTMHPDDGSLLHELYYVLALIYDLVLSPNLTPNASVSFKSPLLLIVPSFSPVSV